MQLKDYPRPQGDTGIGFHWWPDVYHYDQSSFNQFVLELAAMGTSWLLVMSEPDKPIPRSFIHGLQDRHIEPIIRIYTPTVETPIDQGGLRALAQTYASWNVHYIHVYNEPNLSGEWAHFDPNGLPERFMDYLLLCLDTLNSVPGIIPVFTPLSPGGNYWDTDFLKACFEIINLRDKQYLYEKMAVGIHNYAINHSLDWGGGGLAAWPCAAQHPTPPGCQDHIGFHLFEWYDEIVRARVGYTLPMICGENGMRLGDHDDPSFPAIDEMLHAQRSVEMSQLLMENQVPDYVFNNAFWLVCADDASPFSGHRWYKPSGEPAVPQSVAAMKALPKHPRPLPSPIEMPIRVLMPNGQVVTMELEEYLRGVVPSEMPAAQPIEALKAQAIAARCYALRAIQSPRHDNADICATQHCQVWTLKTDPRSDQAVADTKGVIATYDAQLISAYYFGRCDGLSSRNSEQAYYSTDNWKTCQVRGWSVVPYCRAVPCTGHAPHTSNCGFYGHGVGMCQTGAVELAKQGKSYQDILERYYTGIVVQGPPPKNSIIQGTVTDTNGAVVPNQKMLLDGDGVHQETNTNAQGRYSFIKLPAGIFSVEAAGTGVKKTGLLTDGTNVVIADFVVPPKPRWSMSIERRPGVRAIAGSFPRAGISLAITDPWGNSVTVVSGTKPEFGLGGFEALAWTDGTFTLRFLDQTFTVEVRNDFVVVTFTESVSTLIQARLVSGWMPQGQANGLLLQLESDSSTRGLFIREQEPAGLGGWTMTVEHKAGVRAVAGQFPREGISLTVTDPWGNSVTVVSGSKPEFGPGGFEALAWADGTFTLRFLDQTFTVDVRGNFAFVTFTEEPTGAGRARLVTNPMPLQRAQDLFNRLNGDPRFTGIFTVR
jgi:hypothetical protein